MTIKLTKNAIDGLPAPSKGSTIVRDSEVIGFAVRIKAATKRSPQGARSFILLYSLHGQPARVRIGAYPTWSVEAARAEANDLRKRVDRGEDPAQERREQRQAPTVDELAQRYIDEHLPTKGKRAQKEDKGHINRLIKPALGKRLVSEVQTSDVTTFHLKVTKNNGPVAANRIVALLSKMFSLALEPAPNETKPWRSPDVGNPCKGVKRNEEFGRERFYSEEEIALIGDALSTYHNQDDADCVRFIMLTGCRPCEAINAQWSSFYDRFPDPDIVIDDDKAIWFSTCPFDIDIRFEDRDGLFIWLPRQQLSAGELIKLYLVPVRRDLKHYGADRSTIIWRIGKECVRKGMRDPDDIKTVIRASAAFQSRLEERGERQAERGLDSDVRKLLREAR